MGELDFRNPQTGIRTIREVAQFSARRRHRPLSAYRCRPPASPLLPSSLSGYTHPNIASGKSGAHHTPRLTVRHKDDNCLRIRLRIVKQADIFRQDITEQYGSLVSKTLARRTDAPMLRRVRHQAAPITHNVVVVPPPPFNRILQISISPCAASCGFALGARSMSGVVCQPRFARALQDAPRSHPIRRRKRWKRPCSQPPSSEA